MRKLECRIWEYKTQARRQNIEGRKPMTEGRYLKWGCEIWNYKLQGIIHSVRNPFQGQSLNAFL
jgi:hypothetical protein